MSDDDKTKPPSRGIASDKELEAAKRAHKAAIKEQRRSLRDAKEPRAEKPRRKEAAKASRPDIAAAPKASDEEKAERKAAKLQAKAAAKAARRAGKPAPQDEAAKAERKAAKLQAKEAAKAARRKPKAAQAASAPEAEKAARKAAKQKAKEEKKSQRRSAKPKDETAKAVKAKDARKDKTPDAAPDDAAAKAQRKAEKQKAKDAAKAERRAKKTDATPEDAAAKAARKAAKLKAKEDKKNARRGDKTEAAPRDEAAKAERKAAKLQAKEAAKAARRSKKPDAAPEDAAAAAERKAAKLKAKEDKKNARRGDEAGATPKDEAAKAERKAAKLRAKEAAKAARRSKTPDAAPEDAAAAAERKAAKLRAKEDKKNARRGDKAEATPKDEAAKAERKAAKLQAKDAAKAARRTKPPEDAAAAAERKAAKLKAKEDKKNARRGDKAEATPEDEAAKAERKATKLQAKEVAKAARRSEKPQLSPEEIAAKAERKTAKAAAKADKKAQRGESRKRDDKDASERDPRAVRLSLAGTSAEAVTPLGTALENEFRLAGVTTEAPKPEGRADLIIHTFDTPDVAAVGRYAATVAAAKARLHVFVEPSESDVDVARAIVRLAAATGGTVVSTSTKLKRFGLDETLTGGQPNDRGLKLIAESIVGIAAAHLSKHSFTRPDAEAAPDLAAARAAAAAPEEFLSRMRWSSPTPPKAIWTSVSQEDVEAFADSRIVLPSETSVALGTPFDWGMELPDRKAGFFVNGLDFLTAPLTYWYAKANNQTSDKIAAIDAALKERGTTPNALLARATQIILDFIEKHPRSSAPSVWDEKTVTRRAPVLALFILCCKAALKRKIKFSEAACTAVLRSLFDHIEALRADDFYMPCSVDGIEQDSLTIGIALALRGTEYGSLALSESLTRLKRLQIDPGLSAEGVWLGDSYGTHCAVLAELTGLFSDIPPADAALIEPLAAAAKRMTAFAEAMLKSNGQPPAIDESKEKSYAERLSGARKTIARAGGKQAPTGKAPLRTRITDTYVFREAQYFISHSSQKVSPESSLVVLHAAAPSLAREHPGGVTLVFAYGESNLLIRTEPGEDAPASADEPAEFNPALRNGYRIDGEGNVPAEGEAGKSAHMVKSWRGPGWAAAKSFESNYDGASVSRTAVHLKAAHALIVVDELTSDDGEELAFEQFWNIAPDFAPPETTEQPLRFVSPAKGCLTAVLEGVEPISVGSAEAGARIRCEAHLGRGVTAALFQWTAEPAEAFLAIERDEAGDWVVVASGKDFSARLSLSGNEFGCELTGA